MKKVFSVCLSVLLMILLLCTGVIGCNRPQTNATPSASINANETAGTASSVQPTILPTVENTPSAQPTAAKTPVNTKPPQKTTATATATPTPTPTPAPTFNVSKLKKVDLLFVGNSFTQNGNIPLHFSHLDQNKKVYITELSKADYFLATHVSELKKSPQEKAFEQVDAVILQEYGGGVPMYSSAEELMELIGQDKAYYGFTIYPEADTGFAEEDILALKNVGVRLVLMTILQYAPELALEDFLQSDMKNPTNLYGYTIALALYCTIFDVKAVDQNNGALSAYDIPGATRQEDEAYMTKLKKAVQRMVDDQ